MLSCSNILQIIDSIFFYKLFSLYLNQNPYCFSNLKNVCINVNFTDYCSIHCIWKKLLYWNWIGLNPFKCMHKSTDFIYIYSWSLQDLHDFLKYLFTIISYLKTPHVDNDGWIHYTLKTNNCIFVKENKKINEVKKYIFLYFFNIHIIIIYTKPMWCLNRYEHVAIYIFLQVQ